jgi:hypothetical protein
MTWVVKDGDYYIKDRNGKFDNLTSDINRAYVFNDLNIAQEASKGVCRVIRIKKYYSFYIIPYSTSYVEYIAKCDSEIEFTYDKAKRIIVEDYTEIKRHLEFIGYDIGIDIYRTEEWS